MTRARRNDFERQREGRPRRIFHLVAFPLVDQPHVSVIVAAQNSVWKTVECLEALRAQACQLNSFEVIVVDRGSSDRPFQILSRVPGVVIVRLGGALGAMASYNCGAAAARGDPVFLDQDARMTPGCLDALAQSFRDFPGPALPSEAGVTRWPAARGGSFGVARWSWRLLRPLRRRGPPVV